MSFPYTEEMMESVKKVEATRAARMAAEPRRMTAEEKDALLEQYHPDYNLSSFAEIIVGPNKGEKAPKELVELLQAKSRVQGMTLDLAHPDYDVDVLVIGGGTSRKRMHAAADYSGAEIMRVLRDEVQNRKIPVVDFTSAIEIIKDTEGKAAGAVLQNMETGEILIARAKCVIIATGGAGRLHYQGFPTSNHYGATADGLVLAYRAGARLLYQDTLQYHPTGVAFPSQIYGALVTEKVRSMGAQFVNVNGEAFMHPLETRDVAASGVIREVARGNGIHTPLRDGIWLDSPMIDAIHGEGTLEKRLPGMLRMYLRYDIDMRKVPIVIYPTLHYQNGGVRVSVNGMSDVENLYVAGEAAGGVHGRNRLMGNSLLDVIVFGRNAGQEAGKQFKNVTLSDLTLEHVDSFEKECEAAGIHTDEVSPKILPDYRRKK